MIKIKAHRDGGEPSNEKDVNKQEQKILSIPKPDTIVNPWAVVIHIKNASVASRAMVTSFRLKYIAH